MSAPPTGPYGPPGSEGGSKAPLILGVALVFVLVAIGAAVLLLLSSGGDDGGDEAAATETSEAVDGDASHQACTCTLSLPTASRTSFA